MNLGLNKNSVYLLLQNDKNSVKNFFYDVFLAENEIQFE